MAPCLPESHAASRVAIGSITQNGAVAFATTHWSMVAAAQGESPEGPQPAKLLPKNNYSLFFTESLASRR